MPTYEVKVGPSTYQVDAPDENTAWQWANYTHTQAPAPAPVQQGAKVLPDTDTSSDFMRGIKNYPGQFESVVGGGQALMGLAAKKLGFEDTGKSLIQKGLSKIEEGERSTVSKKSDEFTAAWEKGIGTVLTDWLPYQAGAGAANIAESLAFAGVGAGVGAVTGFGAGAVPGAAAGFVSKTLVKQGIKEAAEKVLKEEGKEAAQKFVENEAKKVIVQTAGKEAFEKGATEYAKAGAKKIGSYAGTVAQAGIHGAGEVGGRAIEEAQQRGESVENIDLGRVLPAATVHAIADFVNERIGLGALKIGDTASKYLITDIAKRIAMTGLKETGGEEIQSIAERYGAKLSLADAEALKEYVNTAAASFGMAVAPGAIGGARTHLASKLRALPTVPGAEGEQTEAEKKAAAGAPALTDEEFNKRMEQIKAGKIAEPTPAAAAPSDATQTAKDFLAKVDNGTRVGVLGVNKIINSLGIERPAGGAGYVKRAIDAIRAHVEGKTEEGTTDGTQAAQAQQTETQKQEAPAAATVNLPPEIQAAKDLVTAIDAGGMPLNPAKVNEIAKNLGLEVNKNSKPEDVIRRIREAVARAESQPAETQAQTQAQTQTQTTPPPAQALTQQQIAAMTDDELEDRFMDHEVFGKKDAAEYKLLIAEFNKRKAAKGQQAQADETTKPAIAPEIQEEIDRRQAKIDELRDNGAAASRIKKAEDNLNAYKASVGITGPVLSAKAAPTVYQYRDDARIASLQAQLDDAKQNGSQYQIKQLTKALEKEQSKPANVTLQAPQEQDQTLLEERTQRRENQKESLAKPEPRYEQENIPEHTEELYNDTRESVNEKINADNERRAELVKQHDELAQQLKAIEAEREALDAKSDEANKQFTSAKDTATREAAKAREDELLSQADALAKQETALNEKLKSTAQSLQDHGAAQNFMPEWYKLTSDEKDLYFSHIKRNTLEEHGKAAQALREYRKQKGSREGGYGQKKMSATEHRIALAYEDNREYYSKLFPVKFPRWNDLSEEAKAVFLDKVVQTTVDPITGKATYKYTGAGIQQDAAFAALGVHLLSEKGEMDKATRAKTEENFKKIQQQIAIETKLYEERKAKHERDQQRWQQIMGGEVTGVPYPSVVPSRVAQMVKDGDLKGVLQYLRTLGDVKTDNKAGSIGNKILKAIAQTVFSMDLKTKIQYRETLPGGDLAIYDPVKDVIYVTAEGMTDHVLLHEIVHAATVKVLNHYTKGELKYLTAGQIEACQQLIAIMNATMNMPIGEEGETMQQLHPRAYENIFEFVAYALTDEQLQADLANPELAAIQSIDQRVNQDTAELLSILPGKKSAWTAFKLTMAKLLKLDKFLFDKKGELRPTQRKNLLMEVSAAFEGILAVPTEPIYLDQLAAKGPQKAPKPAAMPRTEEAYKLPDEVAPKSFVQHIRKLFFTQTGHLRLEYFFQNKRAVLRKLSEQMAKAKVIVYTGAKINDIYGQITTAVADAKNYFNAYVDQDLEALNTAVGKYARAAKLTTKEALEKLHPLLEALHEPERRMVKYLLTVPLTPQAAAQRAAIVDTLDTQVLTEAQAKQLRAMLDNLVFTTDAQGNRVITNNVETLGDKYDINAPEYNATGMTREDVQKYTDMLRDDPHKAEFAEIVDAMKKLGVSTAELNKIGHYWSQPVSNRVAFYGWEHYIPLKGNPQHSTVDELLDFDSRAMGRELQDSSGAFGGRFSVSKNPILQMSVDATRAAIRAGQRNLTLAIKNAIEQKLISGRVVDTIPFKERTNKDILDRYRGENHIFHYNDDGTIDILLVEDKNLRNAIRQTFKASNPLIDKANMITGLIAQGHTRYNYNFGPMNFVRDALTNAFVIGAEMSPAKAAQYIKAIASIVVNGGMYKAMVAARLLQSGHKPDIARLKQLGQNDTFYQHIYELAVERGGMVTHLSGLSLKSQFQELQKKIGPSGIMTKKEQFDKFVDTWTNMFEIASRTSAYMVAKQNFRDENLASGMDENTATEEAKARAVTFSKNLANFEQVGEWGKAMGALYMFFRPSATGAARSLQAITPAFTNLQSAVDALPPSIKSNSKALAEFKKNYAEHQKNAWIMIMSLIALGFFAHTMSKMMAPDDDLGRNAVDADDMDRWTRYARFHIPNAISKQLGLGENVVFQMPWGMGLGAFAAMGAQLSAIYDGKTSLSKGLANIFGSIALDSFVPIPVSKMPITEMPLQWLLDSVAPSMARPALELALNKNGLGQAIHNEQSRRFGDAYTGGDNIPEIYKEAARGIANSTTGALDWNPNTLYFLTNTYMDGPARVVETLYGINDLAQGQKAFNPKTDIPLMGSFFGSKVNIDAQRFSAVENKIKRIEGVMKEFATDPEREAQYMAKYPLHQAVVEFYNKELNGNLKQLRAEANEYRLNKYLSPKERQDLLKLNTMQANVIKNEMIEVFKAYGVEP